MSKSSDVVVIGAGVFGAWTAYHLRRAGRSVTLIDAYGAGNSRSSSGGESRVLRAGYGSQEIYSRWALQSFDQWQRLFHDAKQDLFVKTGVLWLGRENDTLTDATIRTLQRLGVRIEQLSRRDLEQRYAQFDFGPITRGVLEPESGVLLARRAVQIIVQEAVRRGVQYRIDAVASPPAANRLEFVETNGRERVTGGSFVFACGPWLPKLFPVLLGPLLQITRQEVFFFGAAPGDRQFSPPAMPTWVDFHEGVYGVPDIEGRGFKIGLDRHGPPYDPDHGDRLPSSLGLLGARTFLAARIPALREAKLLEAKVCQYSNTPNGDLLLDKHPDFDNVWLAGGGSGHGFKHGPAVGEYLTGLVTGTSAADPRFTLVSKRTERQRTVF